MTFTLKIKAIYVRKLILIRLHILEKVRFYFERVFLGAIIFLCDRLKTEK